MKELHLLEISGFDGSLINKSALNLISSRLARKDSTIWGAEAAKEAAIRLDWIDLPESSRTLLPKLDALSAWSRSIGHKNFILCGMGGSSLAPEVIAAHYQKELTVLDSTNPEQIAAVLDKDLGKSCIIIASKSGGTIETASQKELFVDRLTKLGLPPEDHLVVITDPGSPLEAFSKEIGAQLVLANPNVGGRFSALSAFGLVPAALLGIDVSLMLDDAESVSETFINNDSVAIEVAAALADPEFSFPEFFDRDSEIVGIADWIEQLVAESTGKDGRGVLPIVLHDLKDVSSETIRFQKSAHRFVVGTLGAQFIFWEWVTALLCYLLKVDPFNQPNVAEAKELTNKCLAGKLEEQIPVYEDEVFTVYATESKESIEEYLKWITDGSYIAIMAYLNRQSDKDFVELRSLIANKFRKPVTFGWGPRFLHSTGQFHKGGPLIGAFLQITADCEREVAIPGVNYDFQELLMAQAKGDYAALSSRDLPVLRINLKNKVQGLEKIKRALS